MKKTTTFTFSKFSRRSKGQVGSQALFWVVFGIVAVGLVLLLVSGAYLPQTQPQAAEPATVTGNCPGDGDKVPAYNKEKREFEFGAGCVDKDNSQAAAVYDGNGKALNDAACAPSGKYDPSTESGCTPYSEYSDSIDDWCMNVLDEGSPLPPAVPNEKASDCDLDPTNPNCEPVTPPDTEVPIPTNVEPWEPPAG